MMRKSYPSDKADVRYARLPGGHEAPHSVQRSFPFRQMVW